jgi:molybdopterin synthase catalytic subunit
MATNENNSSDSNKSFSTPPPSSSSSSFLIQVSEPPLPTYNEIQKFLSTSSPNCGAIATFAGITRNSFQSKTVLQLHYEGYTSMALSTLHSLCVDAKAKYPTVDRIVAVHIIGSCNVGETSVIVGCNAPHRKEALACTEYLIDELKARVPIWKKEIYEDDGSGVGGGVWKENVEWREGRRCRVMVKEQEGGELLQGTKDEEE